MEFLLHYTWRHKLFPMEELRTAGGDVVEVIDPGLSNSNAGPDFFNAKLKIGGTLWVGNVEIHLRTSDWYAHHHDVDKVYDSVILHVVGTDDGRTVCRSDGTVVPLLVLPIPEKVKQHYGELMERDHYPPCHEVIPQLSKFMVHSFLSALQVERLTQKAVRIESLLKRHNQDWEQVFFITLARNFGFGVNSEAFEFWAEHVPLQAVNKHRDNLLQIEAIFFGQAGLLNEVKDDDYLRKLQSEYRFLSHKFGLQPMDASRWRFLRMRPNNFPHIRLAQLAYLYFKGQGLLSRLLEAVDIRQASALFVARTSAYWETHYLFGEVHSLRVKQLSKTSRQLLVINTLSPFLYAYGRYKNDEILTERAVSLLEVLKAEDNHIIRMWVRCGLEVKHAADSQALIQLKREYCDVRKCLHCRIGYEYLKRNRSADGQETVP